MEYKFRELESGVPHIMDEDESKEYDSRHGDMTIILTTEHLEALKQGKVIMLSDDEYSTRLKFQQDQTP
jgi:hypothetical protein